MQKKFIALAVAGLVSGAAFAQSNVQIYGVADASFESVSASGASSGTGYASRNRIATNSSLIGFKGAEALGNGLTTIWQIENQVALDGPSATTTNTQTMANGWNTRDTYVGLTGGFGTVLAGYISTLQRSTAAKFDLMPGATGSGSSLNMIGRVNVGGVYAAATGVANTFGASALSGGQNNIGTIFRSQAVAYITPTFSGFNAAVAYVPNENRDNTAASANSVSRNPSGWNVSGNYDNGPLAVSLAYLRLNDIGSGQTAANTTFNGAEKHNAWLLGASYAITPDTKVSFMYDRYDGSLGLTPAAGSGEASIKRNGYYLGIKQGFGASDVTLVYMKNGDNSVSGLNAAAGKAFGDDGAQAVSLRYAYNASKRTQFYAIYTEILNKTNGNYDFSGIDPVAPGGTGGGNGVVNAGADPRVIGVGIRHSF